MRRYEGQIDVLLLKFKTERHLLFKASQAFGVVTFLRGTPVPHTQP